MHIQAQQVHGKLSFKSDALFIDLRLDSGIWHFVFADGISINADDFWRIIKDDKILYTSFDDGQRFGLPTPLNLTEYIREQLTGKKLMELDVLEITGDLRLSISDNIVIEIFITSGGYESYKFSFGSKTYIGAGAGNIFYYNVVGTDK